jgi:5-methylcytosine-specific restriction endonuclease McrA
MGVQIPLSLLLQMPYKDPEKCREANRKSCRKYYAKTCESRRDAKRQADRERYEAKYPNCRPYKKRTYSKVNRKERIRVKIANRRARLRNATGRLTAEDYQRIWTESDLCVYCSVPTPGVELDHVIPLARGGKHEVSNLVPACKRHNLQKGALLPLEFIWRITVTV